MAKTPLQDQPVSSHAQENHCRAQGNGLTFFVYTGLEATEALSSQRVSVSSKQILEFYLVSKSY